MIKTYLYKALSFVGLALSVALGGFAYFKKLENDRLKVKNQSLKNKAEADKNKAEIKEFQAINDTVKEYTDEEIHKANTSDIKPNHTYRL